MEASGLQLRLAAMQEAFLIEKDISFSTRPYESCALQGHATPSTH
jgi:hypothetical protein